MSNDQSTNLSEHQQLYLDRRIADAINFLNTREVSHNAVYDLLVMKPQDFITRLSVRDIMNFIEATPEVWYELQGDEERDENGDVIL